VDIGYALLDIQGDKRKVKRLKRWLKNGRVSLSIHEMKEESVFQTLGDMTEGGRGKEQEGEGITVDSFNWTFSKVDDSPPTELTKDEQGSDRANQKGGSDA